MDERSQLSMKPACLDYTKFLKNREYAIRPVATKAHLESLVEHHCARAFYNNIYCQIPEDAKSTFLTVFSPNGKLVASTHGDHKIYVCEIATGRLLHTLRGHPRTPWCIAFHPSYNDILASGCLGGEVRVWDLHGGSEVWVAPKNYVITSLAFHPLDKVLVIATHNVLHFWDWSKPEPFATCATATEREKVRYVKFNDLGTKLITGISNLPPESSMSASRSRIMDALFSGRTRLSTSTSSTTSQSSPSGTNLYNSSTSSSASPPHQQEASRSSPLHSSDESEASPSSIPTLEELSEMPPLDMLSHVISRRLVSTFSPYMGGELAASNPEEAISRAREYAEAVTLSTHRFMDLADSRLADPLSSEQMMEEEEELGEAEPGLLEESPPSSESNGTTGLSDDFWLTFFRLRLLCTQMEQQIHQETSNVTESNQQGNRSNSSQSGQRIQGGQGPPPSPSSSSSNMWRVQEELETSVVSLLTRLQQSLVSLHLASTFARSQILQVRLHIREILVKLTAEGRARRRRRQLANLDPSQGASSGGNSPVAPPADRVHTQRCAVCVPPIASAGAHPVWDPQYCLWLLETCIQLARQMQNILVAEQRLSQLRAAPLGQDDPPGSRLPSSFPSQQSAPSETNDTSSQAGSEESSLSRRLRFRRLRHLVNSSNLYMPHSLHPTSSVRANGDSIYSRWLASRRVRSTPPSAGVFRRNLLLMGVQCPSENDSSPEANEPSPSHASSRHSTHDSYSRLMSTRHSLLARMQSLRHRLYNSADAPASDEGHQIDDLPFADGPTPSASPPSWPIFLSSWISRRRGRSPSFSFRVRESRPADLHHDLPAFIFPQNLDSRSTSPSWSDPFYTPYGSLFFEPNIRARLPTMIGIVDNHPNLTHRIQCWDFSNFTIPNITNTKANVVLARCRIHNDGSVAMSVSGHRLAALVPAARGAMVVTVVSLDPKTLGQCLYTWRAGPNVVSLSLSPLGRYLLVGLTGIAPRLLYLEENVPGSLHSHIPPLYGITRLTPRSSTIGRLTEGVNIIRWLPLPGQGFVYGTNRGTVTICHTIRSSLVVQPKSSPQMHATTATQTSEPQTNTTSTQTTSATASSALW